MSASSPALKTSPLPMRTWKIDGPPEMVEGIVMNVMTSCSLRPARRARKPPMAWMPSCELPAMRMTASGISETCEPLEAATGSPESLISFLGGGGDFGELRKSEGGRINIIEGGPGHPQSSPGAGDAYFPPPQRFRMGRPYLSTSHASSSQTRPIAARTLAFQKTRTTRLGAHGNRKSRLGDPSRENSL